MKYFTSDSAADRIKTVVPKQYGARLFGRYYFRLCATSTSDPLHANTIQLQYKTFISVSALIHNTHTFTRAIELTLTFTLLIFGCAWHCCQTATECTTPAVYRSKSLDCIQIGICVRFRIMRCRNCHKFLAKENNIPAIIANNLIETRWVCWNNLVHNITSEWYNQKYGVYVIVSHNKWVFDLANLATVHVAASRANFIQTNSRWMLNISILLVETTCFGCCCCCRLDWKFLFYIPYLFVTRCVLCDLECFQCWRFPITLTKIDQVVFSHGMQNKSLFHIPIVQ